MLLYNNRKAHLFSLSDVPIYNSILILLQAPPVTVYKPLFFYVSSTIPMTAYIYKGFSVLLLINLYPNMPVKSDKNQPIGMATQIPITPITGIFDK